MRTNRIALALLLTLASCMVILDPGTTSHYPVAAGNTWNYQRAMSTINFRPIVAGASMRDTTYYFSNSVRIIGRDSLPGLGDTWKFYSTEDGGNSVHAYSFYRELNDSLQYLGYTGSSLFTPKPGRGMRYAYGGRTFASLVELVDQLEAVDRPGANLLGDSIYIEPSPVTTLAYPLSAGKEWTYREIPFRMAKKVLGPATISVPAGRFQVTSIRWFWDVDANGIWDTTMDGYDYVGAKGLMKRSFLLKNLALSDTNSPEPIGYFDVTDDYLLTSMDVP